MTLEGIHQIMDDVDELYVAAAGRRMELGERQSWARAVATRLASPADWPNEPETILKAIYDDLTRPAPPEPPTTEPATAGADADPAERRG